MAFKRRIDKIGGISVQIDTSKPDGPKGFDPCAREMGAEQASGWAVSVDDGATNDVTLEDVLPDVGPHDPDVDRKFTGG
jgi:hypothetical protein